ncbi:MAG: exodeoxyribonuclease V subunit beta [Candidatus Dasytiphilus stammeri]
MIHQHAQDLNPTTIPLYGEILIEASAGTGKTHAISILYLRLLLGLRYGKNTPLKVEEILVVTFTEAATLELKNRIHSHIHELRMACIRGKTNNPQLMLLLSQINNFKQAANVLLMAELHLDTAAIFTIHSFCQRMLYINMIECGRMFKHQIIENDYFLYHKIIHDFWKRHLSEIPINIAKLVLQEWSSPTSLLKTLLPWLKGELPQLKYPLCSNIEQHHEKMINHIRSLKKQWSLVASQLKDLICSSCNGYRAKILLQWINKISLWSKEETQTYFFPREIKKIRQEIFNQIIYNRELILNLPIFESIEGFLSNPPSLREWVVTKALLEIHAAVRNKNRTLLGFDDLIHLLDEALQQPSIGDNLAQRIRSRYPIALIDEFQDTDSLQYRIYQKIYRGYCENALILIGDPKQAIYSFRGADIFSYMNAKSTINNYYTLNTNWRSSSNMVSSINQLFSSNKYPFIFSEIPFVPVKAASKNSKLFFTIDNQPQTALRFCLQPGDSVSFSEYQQFMGCYCATQINNWIIAGQNNHAHLINGNSIRKITPADIFVLVRNQQEATIIQNALNNFHIASIYHSSRENIYSTVEAREILYLLKAILMTNKSQMLRTALATSLFGFDAKTIDNLLNQEDYKDFYQQFIHYRKIWFQYGVMPMLHELIISNKISETLLKNNEERRLIDIFHLIELLQKASFQLDNEYALIRWLELQIIQPNHQTVNQRLNLECNKNIIHIVSIHKSKGLQYPLVWLPFISLFRQATDVLYHDRITLRKILDLHSNHLTKQLADEERLAEDLRILYVALTRSIWHCSIGIAPLIKGNKKKAEKHDLHLSAIGYLIQKGKSHNIKELVKSLKEIQNEDIEIVYTPKNVTIIESTSPKIIAPMFSVINPIGLNSNPSRNNNLYTNKSVNRSTIIRSRSIEELFSEIDREAVIDNDIHHSITLPMSPHTFPRGITSCIFLHELLKIINFAQSKQNDVLETTMKKYGLNIAWMPVLNEWIDNILHVCIDNIEHISLSKIVNHHKTTHWRFNLKANSSLKIHHLHEIVRHYSTYTSEPSIKLNNLGNLLKGCIDLIFKFKNKYYLIDYKTIWLGKNTLAYDYQSLEKFIRYYNYDWQYILYTLAFHRYLQYYSSAYDYDIHFGGVYSLFLRGITRDQSRGIWKFRPNKKLITTLDQMFLGNKEMKYDK